MIRLGYACMNLTLDLTTNHTTRLTNLGDADRVRAIVRRNIADVRPILAWNSAYGFALFRLGQQIIPFASHPDFPYDWRAEHGPELKEVGRFAARLGQRLSMHPGQYVNPGSPDAAIVERSLAELEYACGLVDLIASDDAVVIIHLGGVYDDRRRTLDRFVETLKGQQKILKYLVLENDERCWAAAEAHEAATRLGVPMIFDILHHRLNPGDLSAQEAVDLAFETWSDPGRGRPKFHLSTQDPEKNPGAHAGNIAAADLEGLVDLLGGFEADIMLEAKNKDQSLPRETVERYRPG